MSKDLAEGRPTCAVSGNVSGNKVYVNTYIDLEWEWLGNPGVLLFLLFAFLFFLRVIHGLWRQNRWHCDNTEWPRGVRLRSAGDKEGKGAVTRRKGEIRQEERRRRCVEGRSISLIRRVAVPGRGQVRGPYVNGVGRGRVG